jgi:vancomycin aglycone glucosyltransferase
MKIVLAPAGTRGDVEPLVALALELKRRGHQIVFCAPVDYEGFVRSHGLPYEVGTPSFREFLSRLKQTPFLRLLAEQTDFQFEHLSRHVADADAIVGLMLQLAGPSLAQRHGIPYFSTLLGPVFIRSDSHPPSDIRAGSPEWNLKQWAIREYEWNEALLPGINKWRQRLEIPLIENAREYVFNSDQVLFAWEEALAAAPPDTRKGAWAGSLFLETGVLDPDVANFCDEGSTKPVFIGFGSMIANDTNAQLTIILEAVKKTGKRSIVGAHTDNINGKFDISPSCKLIVGAPFWQLFPRCAAIVHHGGSGTTATAARSGTPQAIIPQWSDQYFWSERIAQLGIGPRGFRLEELQTDNLAELITELELRQDFRSRAAQVAAQIDTKRGIERAADLIVRSVRTDSHA